MSQEIILEVNENNDPDVKLVIPSQVFSDAFDVEMRKTATDIEWKLKNDTTWLPLVALADIKGETGEQGEVGTAGRTPQQFILSLPLDNTIGEPGDWGTFPEDGQFWVVYHRNGSWDYANKIPLNVTANSEVYENLVYNVNLTIDGSSKNKHYIEQVGPLNLSVANSADGRIGTVIIKNSHCEALHLSGTVVGAIEKADYYILDWANKSGEIHWIVNQRQLNNNISTTPKYAYLDDSGIYTYVNIYTNWYSFTNLDTPVINNLPIFFEGRSIIRYCWLDASKGMIGNVSGNYINWAPGSLHGLIPPAGAKWLRHCFADTYGMLTKMFYGFRKQLNHTLPTQLIIPANGSVEEIVKTDGDLVAGVYPSLFIQAAMNYLEGVEMKGVIYGDGLFKIVFKNTTSSPINIPAGTVCKFKFESDVLS